MSNARSRLILVIFLLLVFSLMSYGAPHIPIVPLTQGSLCVMENPDFTHLRYKSQVPYCKRNVESFRKQLIYEQYGINREDRTNYTIDHIVPLSIGGSNLDNNLWPEHKAIKRCRQSLEMRAFKMLEADQITQAQAIEMVKEIKFHHICLRH